MLLPRVTSPATSSLTPAPDTSSVTSHTSTYNTVSIIIAAVALTVGLTLFYLFYWRKRPSNPEPRLCVSKTGVARFVTGDAVGGRERQRLVEQARREREERDHCTAEWRAQEGRPRDGVSLPEYSRASESIRSNYPEMVGAAIRLPPPTYDQTVARPPSSHRAHA